MKYDLAFGNSSRLLRGGCSQDLADLTSMTIPGLEVDLNFKSSPDSSVYYSKSDDLDFLSKVRGIPKSSHDFGFIYTIEDVTLDREQAKDLLLKNVIPSGDVGFLTPEEIARLYVSINNQADELFHSKGSLFGYGLCSEDGRVFSRQFVFSRWCSRAEFEIMLERAQEIRAKHLDWDRETVDISSRWESKPWTTRRLVCERCDLNVNPIKNVSVAKMKAQLSELDYKSRLKLIADCLQFIKGEVTTEVLGEVSAIIPHNSDPDFVGFIDLLSDEAFQIENKSRYWAEEPLAITSKLNSYRFDNHLGKDPIPGCSEEHNHTQLGAYLDFLLKHGEFPLIERLSSSYLRITIDSEEVKDLAAELSRAREIIERAMVPGLAAYTAGGKLLYTLPFGSDWMHGDSERAYAIGVDRESGLITLVHQAPSLALAFHSLPAIEQKALLENIADSVGNNGIDTSEIPNSVRETLDPPKFNFTEILYDGSAYWGVTSSGKRIELFTISSADRTLTPFSGLPHSSKILRVTAIKTSANGAYEDVQGYFERFVTLALKFKLPLEVNPTAKNAND